MEISDTEYSSINILWYFIYTKKGFSNSFKRIILAHIIYRSFVSVCTVYRPYS